MKTERTDASEVESRHGLNDFGGAQSNIVALPQKYHDPAATTPLRHSVRSVHSVLVRVQIRVE
jgi:hypothetical protein